MKIRIQLPTGEQLLPVPGPLALQLLAGRLQNDSLRAYLLEPGRCQALYEELERCGRQFPRLKLIHVQPAGGGEIAISLEV
ncbi:MAG: hypothetical protein ACOX64_08390 [Candidatus Merdivicinus sp.]|jgi:hypothetical protein